MDVGDVGAHTVDVVGQVDAGEGLNNYDEHGFLMVDGRDVSKAYCEHDGGSPVIRPTILLDPRCLHGVDFGEPVLLGVEPGDHDEDDCQEVGDDEVGEEDLHQSPTVLLVGCVDEFGFQGLDLRQTVPAFEHEHQPGDQRQLRVETEVQHQSQPAGKVNGKFASEVELRDFPELLHLVVPLAI